MTTRIRSPRERKTAFSQSEPSSLKVSQPRTPVLLPFIKSKKSTFYDQIIISPDFVDINSSQNTEGSRPPQSCYLGSSRSRIFVPVSTPNMLRYNKLAEQDRVVQQYEQNQERYRQLVMRIKQKSLSKQRRKQKDNLSLIYQRLMGIM